MESVIIVISHRIQLNRWLNWSVRALWASALIALGLYLSVMSYSFHLTQPSFYNSDSDTNHFDIQVVGLGALSLNRNLKPPLTAFVERELIALSRNTRPDAASSEKAFLLKLKTSKQQQTVTCGQQAYLDLNFSEEQGLSGALFSQQPAAYWIKPLLFEDKKILVELGKNLTGQEKKTQILDTFFLPTQETIQVSSQILEYPFFNRLRQMKWWGQDALFRLYGGSDYQHHQIKQKLETEENGTILLIQQGDLLIWKEERWQKSVEGDQWLGQYPLALVKLVSQNFTELEAWDETGFYTFQLKLPLQKSTKAMIRPEQIITHARLRTSSQISCLCGKRRLFLKPGDWLIKTKSNWHILKSFAEIEDYLEYRVRGELLIIDAIDQQSGKLMLKGHLFDEMRTQADPVSFSLNEDKQLKQLKKKKNR